eukprot:TRINITY_DN13979_c0_g2_i1.p1 TRINITY_DN13979_c0_g2~~TRINITY_DN13979_c0_g2_i1.p1  ORF type:complete len:497 (+),score=79.07 TRINITY_DN13979_c0_g2_i1:222-1712(+)
MEHSKSRESSTDGGYRYSDVDNSHLIRFTSDDVAEEDSPFLAVKENADQEFVIIDQETGKKTENERVLGTIGLAVLIYFTTCGAVFGCEAAVGGGGVFLTLLGFVIFPIFLSGPLALVATELSTMMNENGGSVVWIQKTFGSFWGWMAGWMNFISGLFSVAVWPSLIFYYLSFVWGLFDNFDEWSIKVEVVIIVFLMSAAGISVVGHAATILFISIQIPFIVELIVVIMDGNLNFKNWLEPPANKDYDYGTLINTLLWLFAGYDLVGTFAGEIKDVKRSMPKGILFSIILSIIAYAVPIMVATLVQPNSEFWQQGYLVGVAFSIRNWLGYWMAVAAVCNGISQYSGILNAYSRSLWVMGRGKGDEIKFFPIVGYTLPYFRTPVVAQLFLSLTTIILMPFSFDLLIASSNILYSLLVIFEFITFVYLKFKKPHAERPFEVPGGKTFAVILVIPPIGLMVLAMAFSGYLPWVIDIGLLSIMAISYFAKKLVFRLLHKS